MVIKSEIVSWPAVCQRLPGDLGFTGSSVSIHGFKDIGLGGARAGSSGLQGGGGQASAPGGFGAREAGTRHPGAPTCTPSPTHHPCLPTRHGCVWGGRSGAAQWPSGPPQHGPLPECLHGVASPTQAARANRQPCARSHPSDPLGRLDRPGGNARVRGRCPRSWMQQEGRPRGCAQPAAGTGGQVGPQPAVGLRPVRPRCGRGKAPRCPGRGPIPGHRPLGPLPPGGLPPRARQPRADHAARRCSTGPGMRPTPTGWHQEAPGNLEGPIPAGVKGAPTRGPLAASRQPKQAAPAWAHPSRWLGQRC